MSQHVERVPAYYRDRLPVIAKCPNCGQHKWVDSFILQERQGQLATCVVCCLNCGHLGPEASNNRKAITLWNERANA